nr:type I-B CRISPR-associated protein Cas8b1/Cst1 [Alkalibaculum sporogenes]
MNDWLFNAGLVGLVNILQHAGDPIEIKDQYVEFDSVILEGFEEKYFKYLIDKYEMSLSWYKIVSYENTISYFENSNFESFTVDHLENLNHYIKDIAKYYFNSASYKAAYEIIYSKVDVLSLVKKIETIKLKKNENVDDKIEEIKEKFTQLKVLIHYCKEYESKKYLAGKNVIYTIVKNAWNGVSFLNSQTKEKDMYDDYNNYFIIPIKSYIDNKKATYKYNCFVCNKGITDLKNDLSFLNNTGFDVSRKSSHVWHFNNDVALCPVCKLVYSCIPAGMTYVSNKGIYINEGSRLQSAININNKIKTEMLKETQDNRSITYRGLVYAIHEQFNDGSKYDLADIQVVKYEEEKYRFNILSKQMLRIINLSKEDLNNIINCGFTESKMYFNVYELVMERILNNQNLFTLIHKLLVCKLSNPTNCRFSMKQVQKVLTINLRIMEGLGYMEKLEKDIIKQANTSGYYLREEYRGKGSKDKLNGISYRLLNALKTSNKNMFMDTLLNCYLYAQKTVPMIFLEALKDDEKYKTIGYAFVTGLIEGKETSNKNGGDKND